MELVFAGAIIVIVSTIIGFAMGVSSRMNEED